SLNKKVEIGFVFSVKLPVQVGQLAQFN
ncbi:hypothetical protein D039_2144B, partial [Vibrio parahaemolyticus EKP-028]